MRTKIGRPKKRWKVGRIWQIIVPTNRNLHTKGPTYQDQQTRSPHTWQPDPIHILKTMSSAHSHPAAKQTLPTHLCRQQVPPICTPPLTQACLRGSDMFTHPGFCFFRNSKITFDLESKNLCGKKRRFHCGTQGQFTQIHALTHQREANITYACRHIHAGIHTCAGI